MEETDHKQEFKKLAPIMLGACISAIKKIEERKSWLESQKSLKKIDRSYVFNESMREEARMIDALRKELLPLKITLEKVMNIKKITSGNDYYHYQPANEEVRKLAPIVLEAAIYITSDLSQELYELQSQGAPKEKVEELTEAKEGYDMLIVILEKVLGTERL